MGMPLKDSEGVVARRPGSDSAMASQPQQQGFSALARMRKTASSDQLSSAANSGKAPKPLRVRCKPSFLNGRLLQFLQKIKWKSKSGQVRHRDSDQSVDSFASETGSEDSGIVRGQGTPRPNGISNSNNTGSSSLAYRCFSEEILNRSDYSSEESFPRKPYRTRKYGEAESDDSILDSSGAFSYDTHSLPVLRGRIMPADPDIDNQCGCTCHQHKNLLMVQLDYSDVGRVFGVVGTPNGSAYQDGHGLVTIRMIPDEQGRFGFNVKGGADQGMPIIVSRVAPQTPADVCIPRLNEGDQVLYINGRDVSQHTHEQVVMFIRASRETHSGELVLVVRPNVYIGDEPVEEPDFQYIPDTHHISTSQAHGDALAGSLMLLQEGLESGAALAQFEQLYRKKPGMTMNSARLSENVPKNRYRDISPYDQTRVILKGSGGDYINANFVNMEIPSSGIVNRYIAAQGPLPNTCADFWQMVWEQHSTLVVMLTTNVERGRVKCHQYWPDLYETADFGSLQVSCVKQEQTQSFAFRELTLSHIEDSSQERHITQMQYINWPDHGVPDESSDFLNFVVKVRQKRTGMVEPTIVHCSAGIGRTGVLITMETAMCLIESNQPVYPLDIVRQMRDQRAMLIQTSSQYKFVCEAIMKVYNDGLVKPLPEYQTR